MLSGEKIGRYEIRSRIGAGGMGEVYLAHDEQMNRLVALKILSAETSDDELLRQRFKQEARHVFALNHPNIITIYEVGESADGGWFIAAEYVEGETLRQFMKNAPLKIAQALRFAEQIAAALVAAHERGIVHRDIKPENVMIRPDGYLKVLDFGLAKSLPNANLESKSENRSEQIISTVPGMVLGSVRYMSPEQARGLAVDARTDVWSLGAVLYEMLAGRAAFDGATTSDTLAAVIHLEPPPLERFTPDVPPEVNRIVRKTLQKDADRRYQTSKDLMLDLKNALYEIEHEISLENKTQILNAGFESSENVTRIHHTASANHSAQISNASGSAAKAAAHGKNSTAKIIFASLAAVALFVTLGVGFYRWFAAIPGQAQAAFAKTNISLVNSDGKVSVPAISPDGKYLAYASGETGSSSLVIRQTATDSSVTIVPPTPLQIRTIAFSPSGDYVFYTLNSTDFSTNTLYSVPTLGGTSKKLIVDVDSPPTFAPDGKRFAFMRHVSNGGRDIVFTADADGANLRELTDSNQAGFDSFKDSLAWSPDGEKILVVAGNSHGGVDDELTIGEIAAATGQFKVFNPKKWNRANDLVWFRDGSGFLLAANENEAQSVQIWLVDYASGASRVVTNDLNSYSDLGLSADGSTIITLKGSTVSSLVNFSPATKQSVQITPESPNLEGSSGIFQTSDRRLIYTRNNNTERNLWIADADGKNALQLTSDAGYNDAPVVSANGKYIVFTSSRSGNWRIWRMEIDGKNPVRLTDSDSDNFDHSPNLTVDGKTVVFNRIFSGDRQPSVLMKASLETGETAPIFFDEGSASHSPQISPDGKRIAYTAYKTATYQKKIYIAAFDNGAIGAIEKTFNYNLIYSYAWSPDGKSLTYVNAEGTPNLWTLPLDGGKPQPLTDYKSGRIFNYKWSADGKSLFIVRGIVNNDLVLIKETSK